MSNSPDGLAGPRSGRVPRRRQSGTGACRQGATMVEFAVVAPLVFFFFFAAFEFCRVAMVRHTIDNAVYEGCRVAIIPGGSASSARTRAESVLGTIGLDGATITVSPAVIHNATPEITLTVEVPMDQNTFVPPQFTGGAVLSRTLTMQREGADI